MHLLRLMVLEFAALVNVMMGCLLQALACLVHKPVHAVKSPGEAHQDKLVGAPQN